MGGPSDILQGFQYVYTEIFIRKSTHIKPIRNQSEVNDDCEEDEEDESKPIDNTKTENNEEPTRKKRGRKPKSYYENIAK